MILLCPNEVFCKIITNFGDYFSTSFGKPFYFSFDDSFRNFFLWISSPFILRNFHAIPLGTALDISTRISLAMLYSTILEFIWKPLDFFNNSCKSFFRNSFEIVLGKLFGVFFSNCLNWIYSLEMPVGNYFEIPFDNFCDSFSGSIIRKSFDYSFRMFCVQLFLASVFGNFRKKFWVLFWS